MARQLRRDIILLTSGALIAAVSYGVVRVHADGAPTSQPLWYAGTVLDDSGVPLDGDHSVGLNLTLLETGGGAAACSVPAQNATFTNGRFRIDASACAGTMKAQPDLFAELSVDGKAFPRAKVGAVPYSIEAQHAVSASTAVTATTAVSASTAVTADSAAAATGALKTTVDALSAQTTALAQQLTALSNGLAKGCGTGLALKSVDALGNPVCAGANGVVAIQAALGGASGGTATADCPAGYTLVAGALSKDFRSQAGTVGWDNGGTVACSVTSSTTLTASLANYSGGSANTRIICYGICVR